MNLLISLLIVIISSFFTITIFILSQYKNEIWGNVEFKEKEEIKNDNETMQKM